MNDRDIEAPIEPPDQYTFCDMCCERVEAGDHYEFDNKDYCENCIDGIKDESIPSGLFCELSDGYSCPYMMIKPYRCEKYNKELLVLNFDYYAPKKTLRCQKETVYADKFPIKCQ